MNKITQEFVMEKLAAWPIASIANSVSGTRTPEKSLADRVRAGDYDGVKKDVLQQNEDISRQQFRIDANRINSSLSILKGNRK